MHTSSHLALNKYAFVGPGGLTCACCAPSPGKGKTLVRRQTKKRERAAFAREQYNLLLADLESVVIEEEEEANQ